MGGAMSCLQSRPGVGKAPRWSSLRAAFVVQSNRREGAFRGTKGEDPFLDKGILQILQVVDPWA